MDVPGDYLSCPDLSCCTLPCWYPCNQRKMLMIVPDSLWRLEDSLLTDEDHLLQWQAHLHGPRTCAHWLVLILCTTAKTHKHGTPHVTLHSQTALAYLALPLNRTC